MTNVDLLMQRHFPLQLKFNVGTIYNDFVATDALGNEIAYVKEKLFKFKDHVQIYSNSSKAELIYEIRASNWIDFNTSYQFTDASGKVLGRVGRKGWRSLWKTQYIVFDENNNTDLEIREDNAWVKVWDALFSEIPILGMFTGYVFNPSYSAKRPDGTVVCTLKKNASFFGRMFTLDAQANFEQGEEERILLSFMMMVLLERRRG